MRLRMTLGLAALGVALMARFGRPNSYTKWVAMWDESLLVEYHQPTKGWRWLFISSAEMEFDAWPDLQELQLRQEPWRSWRGMNSQLGPEAAQQAARQLAEAYPQLLPDLIGQIGWEFAPAA